jgi:precorrin-3B synthase
MNVSYRRGACPGLSTPMSTGDGLLVRLMPVDNIALDKFADFCAAALCHGNGTIEVSARGSLQVRGLTPRSAPQFAAAVGGLDLAADGVPVIADPLADYPTTILNANALAALLRRTIAEARILLAPKVSIVVDGGGKLHLDALSADIRLRAVATAGGPRLHLALGGDAETAVPLGMISPDEAPAVVVALLQAIAARGSLRAADIIRSEGIDAFRAVLDGRVESAPPLARRSKVERVGRHALRQDSYALGIGLVFGQVHAETLVELTRQAAVHGAHWVRPAPGRALLLGGLDLDEADAVAAAADRLGFVVDASDPRRQIAACPGAPACASGHIEARAIAAEIARLVPPADLIDIHVSGCAKGCAHASLSSLTIVGDAEGCAVIYGGTARSTAHHRIGRTTVAADVARIVQAKRGDRHG